MNYKKELEENGYFILKNIFTESEINNYKQIILKYIKNKKTITNAGGITIPDFIKNKDLEEVSSIKDNEKINEVLKNIFDNNYRFCSHNDIGINRIVGWHKDKLNGKYSKYETKDIWSIHNNEKHEIVKVLIYLQDHTNNNDGLKVVPKSHLNREIKIKNNILLQPQIGDVIIFDQRLTHRGMEKQIKEKRILVSFGYGKNNIFTDNFEKGTILRQNEQNK